MGENNPCRWVVEGGVRFHVPGCWGTVHDPDGPCHCHTSRQTLDERMDNIESQLKRLIEKLEPTQ